MTTRGPIPDYYINMTSDWLHGIGQLQDNTSAYDKILSFCNSNDWTNFHLCLEITMGAHIVDALAQSSEVRRYIPDDPSSADSDRAPGQNDTLIHLSPYQSVYAYSFSNSRAVPYAFAALLLHVSIALVHIGLILVSPRPWYGSCWESFGQMLIFALRSRAPEQLDNVGGGVGSARTWRRTATVKAIGEEGRLQIILDENGYAGHEAFGSGRPTWHAERVRAEKKYN
jgi:hypothetical protein